MSAGTLDLAGVAAIGTLNVAGDFSHTAGTITETSTGSGAIVFNKTGIQNYTSGGTVANTINFTVNSGSILTMGTNVLGNGSIGTFTLSSGAGICIGDASGITSSGATGNIRVTGTRTYNTGADYTYNGSCGQSTGNGLPSTVHNLTINNSSGITLTSTTSVSNILALTSGIVTTNSNELKVTNTSASAITGYSSSSYVAGNLRRSVSASGSYDFPLGTSTKYEPGNINLTSMTGFTDILGKFTNSTPLLLGLPLVSLLLNGVGLTDILDYGYWTFTPNTSMSGGTYSVTLNEQGHSNTTTPSCIYTVVKRSSVLASWQTLGTHVSGALSGNTASAVRSSLNSFSDFAVGFGDAAPTMSFKNATLTSGTDGQVNAIYKFPSVLSGVDASMQITGITGGASLSGVDNFTSGNGYDNAWQPFVNAVGNTTSSITWKITFKKAGTSTDTTLANVALTAIDIDGDGANLKEFAEAVYPYSYSLANSTTITVSNVSDGYRATGGYTGISNIDSSHTEAMFQVDYQNVNSFSYRTGAVSTKSADEVRQHSVLFKSFFNSSSSSTTLPIELLYFKAKFNSDHVDFDWATAAEINNDYFTIERSQDGKNFEQVLRKPGSGNTTTKIEYTGIDDAPLKGISYYRLKQTDYDGKFVYFPAKAVENGTSAKNAANAEIKTIGPNPFKDNFNINYSIAQQGEVEIQISNSSGQLVYKETVNADKGFNTYSFTDMQGLPPGIYIVNLISNGEAVTKKLIKQ